MVPTELIKLKTLESVNKIGNYVNKMIYIDFYYEYVAKNYLSCDL